MNPKTKNKNTTTENNMTLSRRITMGVSALLLCISIIACSDKIYNTETVYSNNDTINSIKSVTKKIVIIAPMSEDFSQCWRNIINMFEENYAKTRHTVANTFGTFVKFEYECYDERTIADIQQLAKDITNDNTVEAIIGPMFAKNLSVVGNLCMQKNKVLISPRCTNSTEVREQALKNRNFFSLVETDVSETQMILATMKRCGIQDVCMIAPNTPKGDSYSDYFGFWCEEYGLNALHTAIYDPQNIESIDNACETVEDLAFKKSSAINENMLYIGVIIAPEYVANIGNFPKINNANIYYANTAFTPETRAVNDYQGCGVSAEPESGFQLEYSSKYNGILYGGMPQLYDAMLLMMFAEYKMMKDSTLSLTDAISSIFVPDDGTDNNERYMWNSVGMSRVISNIYNGNNLPKIGGASGMLLANPKIKNMINETVYSLYNYNNVKQEFTNIAFASKNGSNKSSSSWSMIPESGKSETGSGIEQDKEINDNWALLVAASDKWQNYRHQADVLTMYQRLKENGFDDDHIVLIEADDIANNKNNPEQYKGKVINSNNEVVNQNVTIDYKLDELKNGSITIKDILSGKATNSIKASENDNIFIFWSGHGSPGELILGDGSGTHNSAFTSEDMEETLGACNDKYRQMLWIIETCYSGSVGKICNGHEGVLCITAAGENEKSIATKEHHPELQLSVSNNFTMLMSETLKQNSNSIPLLNLYDKLYSESMGSHAKCYNASNFGDIKKIDIMDFITAKNKQN